METVELTFEQKKEICISIDGISLYNSLDVLAQNIANNIPKNIYQAYRLVPKSETLSKEDALKVNDLTMLDKTDQKRGYLAQSMANDIIQYARITPEFIICAILARDVTSSDINRTIGESHSIHAYAHNLLQFSYDRLKKALGHALFSK